MLTFNLFRPISITETLIINVDQGYGLNQVISILDKKDLTSRPTILKAYVRIFNSRANIKAGEYLVSKDENIFKLIKKITEGSVYYRQIRLKKVQPLMRFQIYLITINMLKKTITLIM